MVDVSKIPIPLKNAACQMLINDSKVVYHGHIRRQQMMDKIFHNVFQSVPLKWRTCYVVLHEGCLYIYSDELSNKPDRAMSLYGYTRCRYCPEEVPANVAWPFKLVNALEEKEKSYLFSAASQKDMQAWITNIQDQLTFANSANTGGVSPSAAVARWPNHQSNLQSNPQSNLQSKPTTSHPPVQPVLPRRIDKEMEYVTKSDLDDEFDEFCDYSEIDDKDLDDAGNIKKLSNRFNNVFISPDQISAGSRDNPLRERVSDSVLPSNSTDSWNKPPVPRHSEGAWNQSNTPQRLPAPMPSENNPMYCDGEKYLELTDGVYYSAFDEDVSQFYWAEKASEGESIMKSISCVGAYMVRESVDRTGAQTLLVRTSTAVSKYKITHNAGKYSLSTNGPTFDSLNIMLDHYKSNLLPTGNMNLTKPFREVWKGP